MEDRLTNLEDVLRDVYPFIKVTHAEIEETVTHHGIFHTDWIRTHA